MNIQAPQKSATRQAIEAWDLYCEGQYKTIIEQYQDHASTDVLHLVDLACLELNSRPKSSNSQEGLFSPLKSAMEAYYHQDYSKSARLLSQWLLEKDYFSKTLMNRFCKAALKSDSYQLILDVCQKYYNKKAYKQDLTVPLFLSYHHSGQFSQAVLLFENHREYFHSNHILQKAALAYIHLKDYSAAENLLLPLYKELSGSPYRNNFEQVKAAYLNKKITKPSPKIDHHNRFDMMEYGLTLLFQGEYKKSLQVFESIEL